MQHCFHYFFCFLFCCDISKDETSQILQVMRASHSGSNLFRILLHDVDVDDEKEKQILR